MGLFKSAVDLLTGGGGSVVTSIVGLVKDRFPPSMSDKEKSDLSLAITEAENKKDIEVLKLANIADQQFNDRMKTHEGTASDLKQIPFIGAVIIFLRGAQRPVWGFATLFLDFQVFSKAWPIETGSLEGSAFLTINLLVLGFLFGERAVKNVAPLLIGFFGKK